MGVKKHLKNPLIQQYVLEILLPIIGYFFFGWSINIIAAFYLVDYSCAEIARNRRVFKVYKQKSENNPFLFYTSVITGVLLFSVTVWWVWTVLQVQQFDYEAELIEELTAFAKEELWLLFPIVYLVYHIKDVMTFYMPRRFLKYDYLKMVKFQLIELIILTVLIFAGTLVWVFTDLEDVTVLIAFIILKLGFDILIVRSLDSKYIND
jgi:hypothetical protein